MNATAAPQHRSNDFAEEHHVYVPHLVGMPPLGPYLREVWRRRSFAFELARTKLSAQHFNTVFGQLWLVLNPLLLACIYFVLVDILRGGSSRPGFFAHLVAGLFAYQFVSDTVGQSIRAVVGGGRLILNSSFPRVLLPLGSVISAFWRFLPTLLVYIPVHIAAGRPVGWNLLWVVVLLALLVLLASGLAMLVSALQVYFRDLKNLMPYLLRAWLFASPVLYFADDVPPKYEFLLWANPLGELLSAWSNVLYGGTAPTAAQLAIGGAWAVGFLLVGFFFFVSREREFAVRL